PAVARAPSDSTPPANMTFLEQIPNMLVDIPFSHVLGGVVIAYHGPAFPFLQSFKCFPGAHSLPCKQAYEVSQEQLDVLPREAPRSFVVALVFGVIGQRIHASLDAHVITNQGPDGLEV